MTLPKSKKKTPPVIYLIIVILPFILFHWIVPFIADKSIGADYQTMSIQNQMELQFSMKTGTFPLFIPGFASDHSSIALTLGEVFHPLSHLASIMPGYWNGKALQWNTFMRLLSLGLTQMVLFMFLRRLRLNTLYSFLLSCVTVYNMRMLDLFRYGASLEAYTGYLLLCAAIGLYFINPTKCRGPLSIIGSTYLLTCSGHPQMMYYGFLGAGLFLIVTPFFIPKMLPEKHVNFRDICRFWLRAGSYLGLGIMLSLVYILPFYFEFIAVNTERVGQTYKWADSIKDTFIGTLNNFFLPLRSEVHGAFGGSSLFILAALLPILRFFRVKIPRPVWFIWGLSVVVFLYMQGSRTPIHQWVWEYLPFASSFRYAGRISLVMPVLMMLLLAWAVQAKSLSFRSKVFSVTLTPLALLAFASLIIMSVYYSLIALSVLFHSLMLLDFAPFTPVAIRKVPRIIEFLLILSGIATLLTLALNEQRKGDTKAFLIILCLATLIQIGIVLQYGTWIADRHDTPTFIKMLAQKKEKLDYRVYPGTGMYSSIIDRQLEHSFKEPYLGKLYTRIVAVSNLDDAYARMQEERTPQQVFLEGYKTKNDIPTTAQDEDLGNTMVELIYSSFNRLQFRVFSPVPAFFGLSYPYTGHWRAWLNESKVRVYRANGAAHAIEVPKGESLIEFRYWSSSFFWGMLLSCLSFTIISLFFCIKSLTGFPRAIVAVFVLIIGTGCFVLWHNSLYAGNNLGTEYTWTYDPPSQNLAYGKKSWTSSSFRGSPG
jgi:hypothetical protein